MGMGQGLLDLLLGSRAEGYELSQNGAGGPKTPALEGPVHFC